MMENQFSKRAEYALSRMDAAFKRMNQTTLYENEWESAFKWASAWGLAIRTFPRCRHADSCAYRSAACRLGKDNRPFSES